MKKVFIVFLTSFLLGGACTWFFLENTNTNLGITLPKPGKVISGELDMTEFWDVYSIIEKEYFSEGSIKKSDLVEGAIIGMVDALGDKHSEFMNPEINKKFEEALSGDFEGIGAVVEKVPMGIKIERILKGSPAKKYDVRAGDIVIKVDDESIEELDLYDSVDKIKGPAGTTVKLSILRALEDNVLEIQVIREKIHLPSVEEKYFEDNNLAYISLNLFGESTAQEFSKALQNTKDSGAKGLIIDLRDNGGGYLQSSVQILSEFINEGEVLVKTKYRDSYFNQNYYSVQQGKVFDKKIVVLINGNSASASEITAGALKDYNKAILVGEKTYGKGSVQQPFDLEDGSLLKLTVAKWFTPKGINIDAEGIAPDIEIKFQEEDYENTYDRQLEEAKKVLKLYIEKDSRGMTIEAYNKELELSGTGSKTETSE